MHTDIASKDMHGISHKISTYLLT